MINSVNSRILERGLAALAILACFLFSPSLFAQTSPPWTPITGNQDNMVAYGNVYRNGLLLVGSGYYVGTCGPGGLASDCRSVGPVNASGSYYSTIRGNTDGDLIRFFIWEGSTGLFYQATETLTFLSDSTHTAFDLHYTVVIPTYTISGTITLSGGGGLANVALSGLPGTITTNGSGFYTATVNSGWSGTVTPTLTGYNFAPTTRTYTNVTANQTGQDYTATAVVTTYTISGTITLGGSGLANVALSGLPGTITTNGSGFYTATINSGWSGIVTPTLGGYTFAPATRTYTNVTANQTGQDYTATAVVTTYTISGTITLSGGGGLANVALSGLPGSITTNGSGFYTATVNSGWSGTVTPTLTGYNFAPTTRTYTNVTANQTGQDYTATVVVTTYTISGTITLGGSGLANVALSGLPGSIVTDGTGNYTATVNSGWSGTVTPTLTGYNFAPTTRTYTNVTANQTGQDYTATVVVTTYTISGTITLGGSGLANVALSGLPGSIVTDGTGNYTSTVNSGWAGTVTPTLTGYNFAPTTRTYTNVTSNQTGQNYTATAVGAIYTISGTITLGGSGLANVTLSGMPTATTTDASGHYTATVPAGWTGTIVPTLIGYLFTPGQMTYTNVQANQETNYTAQQSTITVRFYAGTGGTVTGTLVQQVPYGGSTTAVTAVANSGYAFATWMGTNGFYSIANPLVVTHVVQALDITANFVPNNQPPPGQPTPGGLRISSPLNGSRVYGIMMIVALGVNGAQFEHVDFFLDGMRCAGSGHRLQEELWKWSDLDLTNAVGLWASGGVLWKRCEDGIDRPASIGDTPVVAAAVDGLGGLYLLKEGSAGSLDLVRYDLETGDVRLALVEKGNPLLSSDSRGWVDLRADAESPLTTRVLERGQRVEVGTTENMSQAPLAFTSMNLALASRFMVEWDTRLECYGWHKVKAIGFRNGVEASSDEISIYVNNVEFNLQVQRRQDQSLHLSRDYGLLKVIASDWGGLGVEKYRILRAEGEGGFALLKEVASQEFKNNTYEYKDCWLERNKRYRYKVEAISRENIAVGASDEAAI